MALKMVAIRIPLFTFFFFFFFVVNPFLYIQHQLLATQLKLSIQLMQLKLASMVPAEWLSRSGCRCVCLTLVVLRSTLSRGKNVEGFVIRRILGIPQRPTKGEDGQPVLFYPQRIYANKPGEKGTICCHDVCAERFIRRLDWVQKSVGAEIPVDTLRKTSLTKDTPSDGKDLEWRLIQSLIILPNCSNH